MEGLRVFNAEIVPSVWLILPLALGVVCFLLWHGICRAKDIHAAIAVPVVLLIIVACICVSCSPDIIPYNVRYYAMLENDMPLKEMSRRFSDIIIENGYIVMTGRERVYTLSKYEYLSSPEAQWWQEEPTAHSN